MRQTAIIGVLLGASVILLVAGIEGQLGTILACLFAPGAVDVKS